MKKNILSLTAFLLSIQVAVGQIYCNEVSDDPPSCLYGCTFLSGNFSGFTPDMPPVPTTCSGSPNTQWIKIIAEDDLFRMKLIDNNCLFSRRIQVEVIDKNQNSITGCIQFRPNQIGVELAASVIPGEEYSVRINELSGLNCNFEFELFGHKQDIVGNTGDIQFEPWSTLAQGELFLPPVPNSTDYVWETFSSDLQIFPDSAGNRLTYHYFGIDSAMICVTPVSSGCAFGAQKCAYLPYIGCPAGSKELPGCLTDCPNLNISLNQLSPAAFMGYQFDCQTDSLAKAYWFSIIAEDRTIVIEEISQIFHPILIQIFDQNGNKVSDCENFGLASQDAVVVTGAVPGEVYSVGVATQLQNTQNSILELNIYGSTAPIDPLPKINFTNGSALDSGVAFIDSTYSGGVLTWESDKPIQIVSGQGTNRIVYMNGSYGGSLILKMFTSECGEAIQ